MQKILIVEDEPDLLDAYAMVLNADGYNVTTAGDGEEALRHCENTEYDLILLDLRMPRVSGLDFLNKFKTTRNHPNVKIIVFSNLDSDKEIDEAYRLGADKYVLKAWASPRELSKLVAESLR